MGIVLKPEQQEFIQQQVALGRFRSEDEVLARALQLLAEVSQEYEDWVDEVRVKVDEAQASLDRGEGIPLDVAMAQLQEKLRLQVC
jgi:antitoxin ParD1/3/4